mmetsp:Transcript_7039/g.10116  ORF Transcript_7039/g.10116 Transcript_7039/m.10116 type:complete len:218 (-) Transcript_7039:192-845(-)
MKHRTSPLHWPLRSRHCPTAQGLVFCPDGGRVVAAAVGGTVGVDVIRVAIGELDGPTVGVAVIRVVIGELGGPVVGVDVIGIVTGELDGEFDGFLVGENVGDADGFLVGENVGDIDGFLVGADVGVDDGDDVGNADGSLVGGDVVGGGVGLIVSISIDVIGGDDGLNVGSSPAEQTLDVQVILKLNPHPLSQQALLLSSGVVQSLIPLLSQCASASA